MNMKNKVKIAAIVVAVIVGMVLYKNHHDKKETKRSSKAREAKDLPN